MAMTVQIAIVCIDRKNRWVHMCERHDAITEDMLTKWTSDESDRKEDYPIAIIPCLSSMPEKELGEIAMKVLEIEPS